MEYTWKLISIKTANEKKAKNVVVQTYWKKIGKDADGNEGEFSGATPFSSENIDPNKFVAFDKLKEEQILGWIQNLVTGEYEKHVNEQIQKQIDQKKKSISEAKFPWEK